MKIAILGANGFLGSYITNHLIDYDILPVTRKEVDLTDYNQVKEWLTINRPHTVINCAMVGGKTNLHNQIYEDVQSNLSIFLNFYNNSNLFEKYINIGSGSEFDIRSNINSAEESAILSACPKESYAYSKNVIARMILNKPNFYTLRLFGCFDVSEPDFRLFKKLLSGKIISIQDRQFDYISAGDFCKILIYYLQTTAVPKDINCVYSDKLYLSQILDKFNKEIKIDGINPLNYTGCGHKLNQLNLSLDGLDKGIKEYKNGSI